MLRVILRRGGFLACAGLSHMLSVSLGHLSVSEVFATVSSQLAIIPAKRTSVPS